MFPGRRRNFFLVFVIFGSALILLQDSHYLREHTPKTLSLAKPIQNAIRIFFPSNGTTGSAPPFSRTRNVTDSSKISPLQRNERVAPPMDPCNVSRWIDSETLLPSPRRRRLELLHIPKTGGSTLEAVAAQHNLSWGACHWNLKLRNAGGGTVLPCPAHPRRSAKHRRYRTSNWHLPIPLLQYGLYNPYIDADIFTVVRHPYARLLSQWNHKYDDIIKAKPEMRGYDRKNPHHLNYWLQRVMRYIHNAVPPSPEYFLHDGHYIPQSHYIAATTVRHGHLPSIDKNVVMVLRHENLSNEFACLMLWYNLSHLQVPMEHRNRGYYELTEAHLTQKTKNMINVVYRDDFVNFGYEKG